MEHIEARLSRRLKKSPSKDEGATSGWGLSKQQVRAVESIRGAAAAMGARAREGAGLGCSDLHQVARCRERQGAKARRAMRARRARRAGKVPFGAFPLLSSQPTWRSARRRCRGKGRR
jgi:hypothetical protein